MNKPCGCGHNKWRTIMDGYAFRCRRCNHVRVAGVSDDMSDTAPLVVHPRVARVMRALGFENFVESAQVKP